MTGCAPCTWPTWRSRSRRCLHRILDELLAAVSLPFALTDTDRSVLIRMARGRPGWVIRAVRILGDRHYWRDGRVLLESLRAEIMMRITSEYLAGEPST